MTRRLITSTSTNHYLPKTYAMTQFRSLFFLSDFSTPYENATKINRNAFMCKYAILKHLKIPDLGHKHLWYMRRFYLVVRPKVAWTYVQRIYGRTVSWGKDVLPKDAWSYVHRIFERHWMIRLIASCTKQAFCAPIYSNFLFQNASECVNYSNVIMTWKRHFQ